MINDELTGCAGSDLVAHGRILLSAHINDFSVWEDVLEKVDGLTVHTVNDVPQALIKSAQRRAKRAEAQQAEVQEAARKRIDELEAALSFANAEKSQLEQQVQSLSQALGEAQETIAWQDQALQSRST